ncbi:hypothetical protein SLS58_008145 [Diplodia intermedia]|uniref:NmrA-like domain-containing protein n=1 Tax=Diplodia intermedia TaxID=856260 RepID=A0ABR3TIY5_9PEZI
MSRALLITGATGQTRRSPSIKLLEGDLDDPSAVFAAAAKRLSNGTPIWGVYSVQASMGKGVTADGEALGAGVSHFVYSGVERGGEARGWDNPTDVPHFRTKWAIERHLRDRAGEGRGGSKMGWTVLRPAIFMDNLAPGFAGRLFMTSLRDAMGSRPLQWVATRDIGVFAAMAFEEPEKWNGRAVGLAGDMVTFDQLDGLFQRVTGKPVGTTFGLLGKALKHGVKEVGTMLDFFKDEGYKADIPALRKEHPGMMDLETWLRTQSQFVKRE